MALKGLRIAYASETDEGRKFSASRVNQIRIDLDCGVLPAVGGLAETVTLVEYCYSRYLIKSKVLDVKLSPAGFINPLYL